MSHYLNNGLHVGNVIIVFLHATNKKKKIILNSMNLQFPHMKDSDTERAHILDKTPLNHTSSFHAKINTQVLWDNPIARKQLGMICT